MFVKKIKYTDYNGVEREEEFRFNLNESELLDMELSVEGGYVEMVKQISAKQDGPSIAKVFKDLILKSYGEKSLDGKHFVKDEKMSKAFSQTEAFNVLYLELATDDKAGAEFINGIIPDRLKQK